MMSKTAFFAKTFFFMSNPPNPQDLLIERSQTENGSNSERKHDSCNMSENRNEVGCVLRNTGFEVSDLSRFALASFSVT